MVFILELRHVFGMIIDDDGKAVSVAKEMAIFHRVQEKIQRDYPLFQIKVIGIGLKILGHAHVQASVDALRQAMTVSKMLVGFDLVNEEDYTHPIQDFFKILLED
jgi:hypothetical protein